MAREKQENKTFPLNNWQIAHPVMSHIYFPYIDEKYLEAFRKVYPKLTAYLRIPGLTAEGAKEVGITGFILRSERYVHADFGINMRVHENLLDSQLEDIGSVGAQIQEDPLTQSLIWLPPDPRAQVVYTISPGVDGRPFKVTYKLFPARTIFNRETPSQQLEQTLAGIVGEPLWQQFVNQIKSEWSMMGYK